MNENLSQLNEEHNDLYNQFKRNKKKIFPGSNDLHDNFAKAIALVESDNIFLKSPTEHREYIEKVKGLIDSKDENPKLLNLYADDLHYVILIFITPRHNKLIKNLESNERLRI